MIDRRRDLVNDSLENSKLGMERIMLEVSAREIGAVLKCGDKKGRAVFSKKIGRLRWIKKCG